MGAAQGCGSCTAEKVLGLGNVERCTHFCGEQRCRVTCIVRKVVIWCRGYGGTGGPSLPFNSCVVVELEPRGAAGKAQRTEAGIRQGGLQDNVKGGYCKEWWVWRRPPLSASRSGLGCVRGSDCTSYEPEPGELEFEVATSTQFAVRVLQLPGPWLLGGGNVNSAPELLGESQLRAFEDVLQPCIPSDSPSKQGAVTERCLCLTLGDRICGQVEMVVQTSCEDLLVEIQGIAKEAGVNLPGDVGACVHQSLLPPLRAPRSGSPKARPVFAPEDRRAPAEGRAKAVAVLPPAPEDASTASGGRAWGSGCVGADRPLGCARPRRNSLSCVSCARS